MEAHNINTYIPEKHRDFWKDQLLRSAYKTNQVSHLGHRALINILTTHHITFNHLLQTTHGSAH